MMPDTAIAQTRISETEPALLCNEIENTIVAGVPAKYIRDIRQD